jgi:hypothetical protein
MMATGPGASVVARRPPDGRQIPGHTRGETGRASGGSGGPRTTERGADESIRAGRAAAPIKISGVGLLVILAWDHQNIFDRALYRRAVDVLRTVTEQLTAREIAERVVVTANIKRPDKAALADLIGTVLASLRNHVGKGVQQVNEGIPARWELRASPSN